MKVFVTVITNLIGFPVLIFGIRSIIPFYLSLKELAMGYMRGEQEKRMVVEAVLISIGTVVVFSILRWKLPEVLPIELAQNIFKKNQHFVAIVGNSTFEIPSILFYPALMGLIYKLKEAQYGVISSKPFIRKQFLPVVAVSLLCSFVPVFFEILISS